ncbi:MAG: trehalase family glycosidase [Spirochaetales bacterium]|nr:trehalase family glycosidase [Spirochaetales bacterium]
MVKDLVPCVHFYDQDFVDMYDRTWVWIEENWIQNQDDELFSNGFFVGCKSDEINLFDNCMTSISLSYSNQSFDAYSLIDFFYKQQTEDGQIFEKYDSKTFKPIVSDDNPKGICPPLLPYVEYCFYHKIGNKKRLKEVVPYLEKYFSFLVSNFQCPNGLFHVPLSACHLGNVPRYNTYYPIDFNAMMAVAALYMSNIGDILNDKELSFRYKRVYFSLKTRINSMMWSDEDHFYYDIDKDEKLIKNKHIGSYWTMLAEIPNDEYASFLIEDLKDPNEFGTDNPFPCVPVSNPCFSEEGNGYCGGVVPFYTYMVIKGLNKYDSFIFARECAIRHMYFILDTLHPDGETVGDVWESYKPNKEGASLSLDGNFVNTKRYLAMISLITITLMIENIIGLEISLPRKTVDWTMTSLESMGIEKLSLKRNNITILSNKNIRGWEIRLESEKLYYFTIMILDENKKKTLPIPSGKCSMLIDKL